MHRPILAALLSVEGYFLTDAEKRLFEKNNPLGVTLFNRNLQTPEQISALVDDLKNCIGRDDIVVALDEEGGRVNRLKAAGFPDYAFPKNLAQTKDDSIINLHARMIAADMRSIGANLNFAPVLDIEYRGMTEALKGRCFSDDKEAVVHDGKIMIDAYINAGICPCVKHMPGHGRAQSDPHWDLPVIHIDPQALEADLYPFRQLRDCPAGMTAHILLPYIDDKLPITLSPKGIKEIIRGRIGFDGLLISDAIDMKALSGTTGEKAAGCWHAGCDVVCYCFGRMDEMEDLCQHAQYLSDKGMERFEAVKAVWQNNNSVNVLDNERKRYYSVVNQVTEVQINYDATEVLHQMQIKGEK